MTFKLTAQAGSRRGSCGVAARTFRDAQPHGARPVGRRHYFGGVPIGRAPYGVPSASRCELITRLHLAAVIEGRPGDIPARSDLSRSFTLLGSAAIRMSATSGDRGLASVRERWAPHRGRETQMDSWVMPRNLRRNLGNPRAEEVSAHRPRQNKGAAALTKAHGAFRKIGEAVNRQGTLTITGSNVRLGTEMPVALSYF